MVTYGEKRDSYLQKQRDRLDRLFPGGSRAETSRRPVRRPVAVAENRSRVKACRRCAHSVSKWSLEAGVKDRTNAAKIERCAKGGRRSGLHRATALNEFLDGKVAAPASWQPSQGIEHCVRCHGPATRDAQPKGGTSRAHGVPNVPRPTTRRSLSPGLTSLERANHPDRERGEHHAGTISY